jgi:hypothetical protein
MNKLLKSYCEKTGSEVMDIYYSDKADEMVIIKDNALKQIVIHSFKGKTE